MMLSATALMVFLLGVAWRAWRAAVLVMCFVAGLVGTLQYLVYGLHQVVKLLGRGGRAVRRRVLGACAPAAAAAGAVEKGVLEKGQVEEKEKDEMKGSDMGPAGPRCVIAEALAQSPVVEAVELPELAFDGNGGERDLGER
jgi:hypothetical protein